MPDFAEQALATTSPVPTLVLGGARSGKTAYAEELLAGFANPIYLATGQAGDAEMTARIERHRLRRGHHWHTVEEPLDLTATLLRFENQAVLVDCLTLWLANLMEAGRDLAAEIDALAAAIPALGGPVVFVANEVGLSIVPDNALARQFRDVAGLTNQRLASVCKRVVFVAAGLPLVLKDDLG